MRKFKPVEVDDTKEAYVVSLITFLELIKKAEADGRWNDQEKFCNFLKYALSKFDLQASELSNDEQISKAAISKWVNCGAMPPAPTRKTVINWVKTRLEQQAKDVGAFEEDSQNQPKRDDSRVFRRNSLITAER